MMLRIVGVALFAATLIGCGAGSELETYPVTGVVTFDGEPIKEGRIFLRKVDGDQKGFSGEIKEGQYLVDAEVGKMSVEVTASRLIPGKFDNSNGTPEPVGEMYIPAKYNSKTTLTTEVTPGGDNEENFDLTSK